MIKFLDLKKINERFRCEMDTATKRVLDSGWYLLGKEVERFEKDYVNYCLHFSLWQMTTVDTEAGEKALIKAGIPLIGQDEILRI